MTLNTMAMENGFRARGQYVKEGNVKVMSGISLLETRKFKKGFE